jgi:putative Ca2+/H+ antiporter (TMEM165/GDT1 family)
MTSRGEHRAVRVAIALALAAVTVCDVVVGHIATAIVCGVITAGWIFIVAATWQVFYDTQKGADARGEP